MAERERELVAGRDAVVEESEVGVAHPAAGHLDQHLPGAGTLLPLLADHRFPWFVDHPTGDTHLSILLQPRDLRLNR